MAIEPRWCLVVAANVDIRLLQKCKRLSVHVSTPLPCKIVWGAWRFDLTANSYHQDPVRWTRSSRHPPMRSVLSP